jgi:hypothetical protein
MFIEFPCLAQALFKNKFFLLIIAQTSCGSPDIAVFV